MKKLEVFTFAQPAAHLFRSVIRLDPTWPEHIQISFQFHEERSVIHWVECCADWMTCQLMDFMQMFEGLCLTTQISRFHTDRVYVHATTLTHISSDLILVPASTIHWNVSLGYCGYNLLRLSILIMFGIHLSNLIYEKA